MKFLPISLLILALATATAFAYDPSPLQDICVATSDPKDGGLNSTLVLVESFFFQNDAKSITQYTIRGNIKF